MSHDEFTKLYLYMQQRFDAIDSKLKQTVTKDELNQLINTVDAHTKKIDEHMTEIAMLNHKTDRHDKWINQIASETHVQLSY